MSLDINIFNQSNRKKIPRKRIIASLKRIFIDEKVQEASINIVFVDDKAIKKINKQYLNHNYATDVISFELEEEPLEGELYISVEMAEFNSKEFKTSWTNEIVRYSIHGVLHILGYDDFYLEDRKKMRKLEDKYLAIKE